jgi:hypothetical protein
MSSWASVPTTHRNYCYVWAVDFASRHSRSSLVTFSSMAGRWLRTFVPRRRFGRLRWTRRADWARLRRTWWTSRPWLRWTRWSRPWLRWTRRARRSWLRLRWTRWTSPRPKRANPKLRICHKGSAMTDSTSNVTLFFRLLSECRREIFGHQRDSRGSNDLIWK